MNEIRLGALASHDDNNNNKKLSGLYLKTLESFINKNNSIYDPTVIRIYIQKRSITDSLILRLFIYASKMYFFIQKNEIKTSSYTHIILVIFIIS